jgi:hypothetical protein
MIFRNEGRYYESHGAADMGRGDVAAGMESEGRGCSRGRAFFLGGVAHATVVRANMRNQIVVAMNRDPHDSRVQFFFGFWV